MPRGAYGIPWDAIGDEEWRRIPGYANYEASALGQIRNANTRVVLMPFLSGGAAKVCIAGPRKAGRANNVAIARLFALAYPDIHERPRRIFTTTEPTGIPEFDRFESRLRKENRTPIRRRSTWG